MLKKLLILLFTFYINANALEIFGLEYQYFDLKMDQPIERTMFIDHKTSSKKGELTAQLTEEGFEPSYGFSLVSKPNYIFGKSISLEYLFDFYSLEYLNAYHGIADLTVTSYALGYQLAYETGIKNAIVKGGLYGGAGYTSIDGFFSYGEKTGRISDLSTVEEQSVDFSFLGLSYGYFVEAYLLDWILVKWSTLYLDTTRDDFDYSQKNTTITLALRIDI